MARCSICDRQSEGLSEYNPMELFHAIRFYSTKGGDIVCEECYYEVGSALSEFVDDEPSTDDLWSTEDKKRMFEKLEAKSPKRVKDVEPT